MDKLSAAALDAARRASTVAEHRRALGFADPNASDLSNYSLVGALRASLHGDLTIDPLVNFVHSEYLERGFKPSHDRAVAIPPAALAHHLLRARGVPNPNPNTFLQPYQTTLAGSGAEVTATQVLAQAFTEPVRKAAVCGRMGARFISGLIGDQTIPQMLTASQATWLSTSGNPVLSGAIAESEGTTPASALTLAPCQVGAIAVASRLFLQQTQEPLANYLLAVDLTKTLASALDAGAIQGNGVGGTPVGVVSVAGTNTVSGTTLAQSGVVSAELAVANSNSIDDPDSLGWITTPTIAAALMQRMKVASTWSPIWEGGVDSGVVNGHRALSSNNVPSGDAVYGDFSNMLVLLFGDAPIELLANPFSSFTSGNVFFRAMMSCNVGIRRGSSWTVITGIT